MPEEKNKDIKKEEKSLSTEEMLKKSLQWSQIIYEQNKKIKRRLNLMVWGGAVKWLIILAPIILGIIFLPPLFKQYWSQYGSLLGSMGGGAAVPGGLDINKIIGNLPPEQMGAITKMLGGGR